MAGLLGEGGLATMPGSVNSTTPVILADFRCNAGRIRQGVDGIPPNGYVVRNCDTSSSYLIWVQIQGLNTTNSNTGAGTKAFPIWPGESQPFQISFDSNDILLVSAWMTDLSGNTTVNNTVVSGGVFIRRE